MVLHHFFPPKEACVEAEGQKSKKQGMWEKGKSWTHTSHALGSFYSLPCSPALFQSSLHVSSSSRGRVSLVSPPKHIHTSIDSKHLCGSLQTTPCPTKPKLRLKTRVGFEEVHLLLHRSSGSIISLYPDIREMPNFPSTVYKSVGGQQCKWHMLILDPKKKFYSTLRLLTWH